MAHAHDDIIEGVRKEVQLILGDDNSGHDMTHIENVLNLARKFARREGADLFEVSLIALLHDVDDHKIVGDEDAGKLTNARRILDNIEIDKVSRDKILRALGEIGYSKRLQGVSPSTLEAKVVSDADMCDGLGTNGILRTFAYGQKCGRPFFDKKIFPIEDISSDKYLDNNRQTTGVCHFFEKILRLKDLMLTESGKAEAEKRHGVVVDFLYNFFEENDAAEWVEYLKTRDAFRC